MPQYTRLKNVQNYGDCQVSDQLESNLISHVQWGLLGIGAFDTVRRNQTGPLGGDESRLRLVSDPRYSTGMVWEGFRQDWVYESGVEYAIQPVAISGVYVNGAFVPAASTGTYAHHIDYPRGRVVFDNPLPSTTTVQCEYSYRKVRLTSADEPWWQEVQLDSLRIDDPAFLQAASGAWNILAENRIQLPAIVVESVMRVGRLEPFQIGNTSRVHRQDVCFHVLTESPFDRKQLHDILVEQWQQRFYLYDKNAVLAADAFPLTGDGQLRPGASGYPALVEDPSQGGYRWRVCEWHGVRSEERDTLPPLYGVTVRATFEIDLP
jgi:hypothetical protein